MLKRRLGFTLVEVLVSLVITGVIGAAATSAFVSQSRFYDRHEKVGQARDATRGALNVMLSEMRMIERTGGVTAANDSSITLRVPFAMGLVCANAGVLTMSRAPVDPSVLNDSAYSGYAWRNGAGVYTYFASSVYPVAGVSAVCTAPASRVIPSFGTGGAVVMMQSTAGPAPGNVIFLYQRITYAFKPSVLIPGSTGLWRYNWRKQLDEELTAPFDASAKFRFFVNDAAAAVDAAPGVLSTLTGIELVLNGVSERPDDDGSYPIVPFTTSVFFKNR